MSRPGTRAVAIGGWSVVQLDLGALHAPLTWIDPGAEPGALAWLPSGGLLLRHAGGRAVLVDCGLGPFTDAFGFEVREVRLVDALAAAGVPAAAVDTVVLTHADTDHLGGIVTGDPHGALAPTFPDARVAALAGALELLHGAAGEGGERTAAIGTVLCEAGVRLEPVADGGEALAGVRLRSAPGHRAGHACVELSDGGARFVHLADVVHAREHVEHPEWDFLHDSEPQAALATRRRVLSELAGSGAVVACSHVDGFGRIERREGERLVWVDLP